MADPKLHAADQEFLKSRDLSKFENTPFVKKVPKPWGFELIFTPEGLPYTGKIEHINTGCRVSLQVHDKKQESYYLFDGECNLLVEDKAGEIETIKMEKGVGYTVALGQKHRLAAVTDCQIFEASTPESGTTYRLEDDYSRPDETEEIRKDPNRGWSA